MGAVYEAFDQVRRELVALKVLTRVDAAGIYRLKQEFRSLADVVHPNLVALHDLVSSEERWCFTMELVRGTDFVAHVRRRKLVEPERADQHTMLSPGVESDRSPLQPPRRDAVAASSAGPSSAPLSTLDDPAPSAPIYVVDEARLRSALLQLTEAVLAIHRAGKLHRDLKPSNVLVSEDGRVVVLDFGLVQDVGDEDAVADRSLDEQRIAGTPAFMAPEQAAGERATEASDWYAVGSMLFFALTGELPFTGTVREVLLQKQLVDAEAPSLVAARAGAVVPPDLEELCLGLLRRAPKERLDGATLLSRLRGGGGLARAAEPDPEPSSATFFGRDRELRALKSALDDSRLGPVVLRLHGEPGIGKSTLVEELLGALRKNGEAVVLTGRCFERESVPFKAFDALVDGLSRYLRRLPASQLDALLPRNLEDLQRLFPVLARVEALASAARCGSFGAPGTDPRPRAFAALRELLARIADRFPLVLAIDDAQFADGDSAELLEALVTGDGAPALLVLALERTEDSTTPSPLLARLLAEGPRRVALRPELLRVLPLGPLELDDALGLALDVLGAIEHDSWALAKLIVREARGNPLIVAALARHVAALGPDVELRDAKLAARAGFDEVLASRLVSLDAPSRALLELLAVAGGPVSSSVLARALGAGAGKADARILGARLRGARLVASLRREGADYLELAFARLGTLVLARMSAPEQRLRHVQLAEAFEAAEQVDPARVAFHLARAEDRVGAARWLRLAIERAHEACAYQRAAELGFLLVALLDPASPELVPVALRAAEMLALVGRFDEASLRLERIAAGAGPVVALALRRELSELRLRSSELFALFDPQRGPTSLFDGLDEAEVRELLAEARLIERRAGELVVAASPEADAFHVLIAGEVDVGLDGRSVRMAQGELLGGAPFLLRTPRPSEIVAASESVRVLELSRATLDRLAEQRPRLALALVLNLGKIVATKLAGVHRRVLDASKRG